MKRDFTYIEDAVDGIFALSGARLNDSYNIFNVGNSKPVRLMDFINALENAFDKTEDKEFLDMQPGDVIATWADISKLTAAVGYTPKTNIEQGIAHFTKWYKSYYNTGS